MLFGSAGVAIGASMLVQRIQDHEFGVSFAAAMASRVSLVHLPWNGFLQWLQYSGVWSKRMGPWHLKHLRFGALGVDVGHAWLVECEHALAGEFVDESEHGHAEVGDDGGVFGL